jgi:hypothetical protein
MGSDKNISIIKLKSIIIGNIIDDLTDDEKIALLPCILNHLSYAKLSIFEEIILNRQRRPERDRETA